MFNESSWDDDNSKAFKFKSNKGKTKGKNKSDRKGQQVTPRIEIDQEPHTIKKNSPPKPVKRLSKNKQLSNATVPTPQKSKREKKTGNPGTEKSFLNELRDSLKGSRFRYLNEKLYETNGLGGKKLFYENPDDFEAYHCGYRCQVEQWPLNPLQKIIGEIRKLPEDLIIADFGCGDAKLQQSVPHKVYSIDLISVRDEVIEADMANVPLKTASIDVAVYSLSLMGTNLQDFFLEANRVLRTGGLMIIAEISSRFDSIDEFIRNVTKCGFHLERRELAHKMFVFFRFKKQQNLPKDSNVKTFSLKPCLYKKR